MKYNNLLLNLENKTAVITINRPQFLNALNKATIQELSDCLNSLEVDDETRVIVITGAENKSFVAGADIKEFVNFNRQEGEQLSKTGHEILFTKIENLSKPVIAAINGFALGGGLELAMSCHVRIASENAKLGLPELGLGLIPGYGGTQRLTQLVGKGRALELMLTSAMIDAVTAKQFGLVNHVYPQNELLSEAFKLAQSIIKNSPNAVSNCIKAVNSGTDINTGLSKEIELFGACFGTEDFKEGTAAFLEKRKPNFK